MDTGRSTGSEGRSAASGQHEEVGPARHSPAASEQERGRSSDSRSADEIQQDIRRTRAEMSETIDALEHRLSPDRLKRQAKGAMHETIDEVKYRLHPQRIAERAGRTMLDTVRDHPLPSLIAGLSIGYLLMKSGEQSSDRGNDYDYRSRRFARGSQGVYEPAYYRERGYAESGYRQADQGSYEGEGRSMSERASESASHMGERVSETAEHMQERAQEMGHRMQERVSEAGHRMQHRAQYARGGMEDFITQNPLAAGAIALGVGALLGSAIPHTRTEDEWMGPMRDEAADRAESAAREGMRRAQEAPEHIAQKATEAAEEVSEKAKSEAQDVKKTAASEAKDVAKEAAKGAKEKK